LTLQSVNDCHRVDGHKLRQDDLSNPFEHGSLHVSACILCVFASQPENKTDANDLTYLRGILFSKEDLIVDILLTFRKECPDEPVVILSPCNVRYLGLGNLVSFRRHIMKNI